MSSCRIPPGKLKQSPDGGTAKKTPISDASNADARAEGDARATDSGGPSDAGADSGGLSNLSTDSGMNDASSEATGDQGEDCQANEKTCQSPRVLATCSSAHKWVTQTCSAACVDDHCEGVCVPDAQRCVDEKQNEAEYGPALQICDNQGQWSTTPCQNVCVKGKCQGQCKPGTSQCTEGNRETCGPQGQWMSSSCAQGQHCVREGECLAPPILETFTADRSVAVPGESVLLQWTLDASGGAPENISLSPSPQGDQQPTPSETSHSFKPEITGEYTLTVSNAAGNTKQTLTLTLIPAGTLDKVHTFGALANPIAIAVSPSGRIVTLVWAQETFTVGAVTVSPQDYYVAEHTITDKTVEVARLKTLESLHVAEDMVFDAENLMVVGDTQTPAEGPGEVALERLDEYFQTTQKIGYMAGDATFQGGHDVELDPSGHVLVAGSSNHDFSGSLVELDRDLDFAPDLASAYITGTLDAWYNFAVNSQDYVVGLQANPDRVNVLSGFPDIGYNYTLTWQVDEGFEPHPQQILALPDGDFVVVGSAGNLVSSGYMTRILVPLGTTLVGSQYNLLQPQEFDVDSIELNAACVNDASEVIVVGTTKKGDDSDVFLHAFSPNRDSFDRKWHASWGLTNSNEHGIAVACDPRGNVLVLGKQVPTSGTSTSFILRFK